MRNFDTLAPTYETLERVALANNLAKARAFCLGRLPHVRHALLIGDGDGRFSRDLLKAQPEAYVDSIDSSRKMLEIAVARAGKDAYRFNGIHANALSYAYPSARYDFIGLHFCLDCFTQEQIDALIPQLTASLKPNGFVAYSDFQEKAPWQKMAVRSLYAFFRFTTKLEARTLPAVRWHPDFKTVARSEFAGGLVFSELLQLTITAAVAESR